MVRFLAPTKISPSASLSADSLSVLLRDVGCFSTTAVGPVPEPCDIGSGDQWPLLEGFMDVSCPTAAGASWLLSLLDPSENFVRAFSIGVPREASEI